MQRIKCSDHMLQEVSEVLAKGFGCDPEKTVFNTDASLGDLTNEKMVRIPYELYCIVGWFGVVKKFRCTARNHQAKEILANDETHSLIAGYFYLISKKSEDLIEPQFI